MGVDKFFFDTYALYALSQGSPAYVRFMESEVVTSVFNLVEIYYTILRDFGEGKAKEVFEKYYDCIIEIRPEIVFEAMKLRLKEKKLDLSYADCIGYMAAKQEDIPFLTGDRKFQPLPNVEFVK